MQNCPGHKLKECLSLYISSVAHTFKTCYMRFYANQTSHFSLNAVMFPILIAVVCLPFTNLHMSLSIAENIHSDFMWNIWSKLFSIYTGKAAESLKWYDCRWWWSDAYHFIAEFTPVASNRVVKAFKGEGIPIPRGQNGAEGLGQRYAKANEWQFWTAFQHLVYFRCYPVGQG